VKTGSGHKNAVGNIAIVDGKYTITEINQVMPIMRGLVTEVSALLRLNEDICQILLQNYKWNKEKLLEMYYSDGDSEKILMDTGVDLFDERVMSQITSSDSRLFRSPSSPMPAERLNQDCHICTAELNTSNSFSLGCKHFFCRDCYGEYIRIKVVDGPR
jgi:ariadne-1